MLQQFSSAIEGMNGGGGFDPSLLIQGFLGGSQGGGAGGSQGGGIGNTLGGLGGAALGTALLPGIGTALGGSIGSAIGGLFGGGGPKPAGGAFDGLHSPTLEPLDDSKWWQGDAQLMAGWAKKNGISVEEVAMLIAYDSAVSGNPPQYVWDAFAYGGEGGGGAASVAGRIRDFNNDNMGARIVSGQLGPSSVSGSVFPAIANYNGAAKQIMLRVKSGGGQTPTIQTMQAAPAPTTSTTLGQFSQLPMQNVLGSGFTGQGFPSLATPGFVPQPNQNTTTNPDPATTDNTTTYALIGGGVALLLLVAVLLFKK
jgi:hypothetical protein